MSSSTTMLGPASPNDAVFDPMETTIAEIQAAYANGTLTCVQLTQWYLQRIAALDASGPGLNSIITICPEALTDAAALDAAYAASGPVGPLHGIPVLVKDQVDVVGTPTTLGSTLFKDFYPDRDAVVIEKLRAAGALMLAKTTLGEFAGGDSYGSLFGATRNPFDPDRTAGGSSGGSGASVSANLGTVAIGQEEFASIRRPAAWNGVVGMRPSLGVVSRSGAYRPWPFKNGSLGPMTRTVEDTARLMDVLGGYDAEDPATAHSVGRLAGTFLEALTPEALTGARIGVIRESIGLGSEPGSEDFVAVQDVFERAVADLAEAGAVIVDDVRIADLHELLSKRWSDDNPAAFENWMRRNAEPPMDSYAELVASDEWQAAMAFRAKSQRFVFDGTREDYLLAREQLLTNVLVLMAEFELDAIVHVTIEHTATLIADGLNPPYVNMKGSPHLNTFLYEVPAITVPAGYAETNGMPVGMTFMGRPMNDPKVVALAYAYEQSSGHRKAPELTP